MKVSPEFVRRHHVPTRWRRGWNVRERRALRL